ncbi:MAG: hypothetical protein HQM09_19645 [Candidatus Riflebacteria bacterium]|nr:hypothetical protein [Candidatus Riflebacteria bacterium]
MALSERWTRSILIDYHRPMTQLNRSCMLAFCLSASVLLLQLVQTRIFGVIFWNHLVYFIITVALMGFGISGTLLAVLTDDSKADRLSVGQAGFWFTVSAIFSTLFPGLVQIDLSGLFQDSGQVARLLLTYALAVFPYFFCGYILGGLFQKNNQEIRSLYFADFLGAGVGCLLFVGLLQPLGAIWLLVICCLLVLLPTWYCSSDRGHPLTLLLGVGFIVSLGWFGPTIERYCVAPEMNKEESHFYYALDQDDEKLLEFSEWNTICRTDIVSTRRRPDQKRIFADGSAFTQIVYRPPLQAPPFDPAQEHMLLNRSPYLVMKNPRNVLSIGSGGGIDIWHALRGRASRIDAVEINPTTVKAVSELYRADNNDLFHRPGVTLFNEEGRSFIKRNRTLYDIIVLFAIDTFAAINSGAYVLSENFLYTVEALQEYLRSLDENGVLCINRPETIPESIRLFILGVEAVSGLGWPEPLTHVAAVAKSSQWFTLLVKRVPFTPRDIEALSDQAGRYGEILIYPLVGSASAVPAQKDFLDYVEARKAGSLKAFFDSYPLDVRPVTDDSPFFFHSERWGEFWRVLRAGKPGGLLRGHWPTLTLWSLMALCLIGITIFIFLPLWRWRKISPADVVPFRPGPWVVYFSCLGLGYIFLEIALMQRFALLLGHPARSLATVLGGFLLASGLGSYFSPKISPSLCFGGIVAVVGAAAFLYPSLIDVALAWSLPGRTLACLALVFPIGFMLGMPFPKGIQRVGHRHTHAVSWMWGINGGATVLGSILAIIIAMAAGFTLVFVLAAGLYSLAFLAWRQAQEISAGV